MASLSNIIGGIILWYGVNVKGVTDYSTFSSVTMPTPQSIMQYFKMYESLEKFGGNAEPLDGLYL